MNFLQQATYLFEIFILGVLRQYEPRKFRSFETCRTIVGEEHEVLADSNSCAAYGEFRRVGFSRPGRLGALRRSGDTARRRREDHVPTTGASGRSAEVPSRGSAGEEILMTRRKFGRRGHPIDDYWNGSAPDGRDTIWPYWVFGIAAVAIVAIIALHMWDA
jgi:hypothetical protein